MGRTYLFECSRCEFRAKVSGRADKGFSLQVQTILCRDCKNLYDAVVRMKLPEIPARKINSGLRTSTLLRTQSTPENTPIFQAALNRLMFPGAKRQRWVDFKLRCPAIPSHRVREWNDPDVCPKCGTPMEKHALPYRIWD